MFFTFYGLQLLRKDMSDIANQPARQPGDADAVPIPVIVSVLPGMEAMATSMMKAKMKKKGVASLARNCARCAWRPTSVHRLPDDGGSVRFQKSDFIDGIEFGGAATFLGFAGNTDVAYIHLSAIMLRVVSAGAVAAMPLTPASREPRRRRGPRARLRSA